MNKLAIVAGAGALPVNLSRARPDALRIVFEGMPHEMVAPLRDHSLARLGVLFEDLKEQGVDQVVFAGGMSRPDLKPGDLDELTMTLIPALQAAFLQGDDAVLRFYVSLFEERGMKVVGAHEILMELAVPEGLVVGPDPSDAVLGDAARAVDILLALSPLDVGQGAVVAAGLCLGVETLQGTDAMLDFVAQTPAQLRRGGGVLVKAPKRGQDLRVDMPAIGPATVHKAAAAGLEGIVVAAGKVLMLEPEETRQAFKDTGLFLMGRVL
ncbi:UDP-2,3-diacylglucosamine diphosphatase LpxI [Shimia sp.]|uniref:LpxI family protein n=1 Tax=Shimia sp. TaxID=1954381 RepID=UPI00329984D5